MSSSTQPLNITVVGIGAMGGGMARALLEANVVATVTGYDRATNLVQAFYQDAAAANKCCLQKPPSSLADAVTADTHVCLVVLQTEDQCEQVCFGSGSTTDESCCLIQLLPAGSCVIVSSTVTAKWMQSACTKFAAAGMFFVDSPVSGGPARARAGDLTLMASGDAASMQYAKPVLQALARRADQLFEIQGGAGMGSTVKMVHQLLAGVHICAAAEAFALAAKAGVDVQQLYQLVQGAAGASWMLGDRGPRMMASSSDAVVKSQLQIFVKDLDIVHAEAKRVQAPVPLASAALQQYIAGQSLGLGQKDDSQVVQVYEALTGVKVSSNRQNTATTTTTSSENQKEGTNVGEYWRLPVPGASSSNETQLEEILEVADEPRHFLVLSNEYTRTLRVNFPPNHTTCAHRHAEDSLYFFLVPGGVDVINHVQGSDPACDCMEFGEVRYGTHKTDQPLVHKITNRSLDEDMVCVDAEVLKRPPVTAAIPLVADKHELIKTRDKCRVYKLTLEAGESVTVSYPFFYLVVVLQGGEVETGIGGRMHWTESRALGDVSWKEPTMEVTKKNVGTTTYVEYIAEWC
jgi:putative dehydrogenase